MSAELARELSALRKVADDEIDMTGMPEVLDWSASVVGKYYRPIKQPVNIRLDADVLAWLRSTGKGYQSRLNELVRLWMLNSMEAEYKESESNTKKVMESTTRAYVARSKPKSKARAQR